MYYIFVKNNEIDGKAQCKCLNDDILNFEVPKDIYDNYEKYIFKDGKIILEPDYEEKEKIPSFTDIFSELDPEDEESYNQDQEAL